MEELFEEYGSLIISIIVIFAVISIIMALIINPDLGGAIGKMFSNDAGYVNDP